MGRSRPAILASACLSALCVCAATAHAGGEGISFKGSKNADGPFAEFTKAGNIPDGESRNVYLRAKSAAEVRIGLTLSYELFGAEPGDPAYSFKWFKGDRNITGDVADDGHDFSLRPGSKRIFRLRIKAPAGAEPICVSSGLDAGGELVGGPAFVAVNQSSACEP